MNERLGRLAAVVQADVLVRLRRPSTVIVFLLLSAVPYLWIPEPSTGRTLIGFAGGRALYNSAAIGMGTAAIGTLLIGLFGFYVISNALRRDVQSRCGYVIASTTLRGSEYIAGKFAGNVAFLTIFTLGFMATSMAMVIVRGEAKLEPFVFAMQYLLLLPPTITFVSAVAITFECTPLLRTKFGDVAYFFLFLGVMGSAAGLADQGIGGRIAPFFDVSGMGFLIQQMKLYYGATSVSIGISNFDPAKPAIVFAGLRMDWQWLLPRVGATLWPIALLPIGRLFFHRFDPARLRTSAGSKGSVSWMGRFNLLARPIAKLVVAPMQAIVLRLPGSSLVRSSATDAVASLATFPIAAVAVLGFALVSLVSQQAELFTGIMPIAWAAAAMAIADVGCREKRAGTTAMVFATPGLRTRFVAWKFLTSLLVAAAFLAIPIARGIALKPESAVPLLAGLLFTVAAATALAIVSSNSKTFIVAFLTFCYIAMNDQGKTPSFDFAGWFGSATPAVTTTYAALGVAALAAAQLYHSYELRRHW